MEEEFYEIDRKSSWAVVYQQIRNQSSNYEYTYQDAKKIENKNLNRYRDVNPYDHSRVRLQRGDKDYINASLVRLPAAKRAYILTQGPLPITTGHFWLMAWEQKSKAVLMLNRIIEKNTVKCHQYWPLGSSYGGEDEMVLNDVGLKVTFLDKKETPHYSYGELQLTDLENGQSRIVLHFHYTTWPDFGVPESPAAFLNFLMAVRESGALNPDVGPPIVHCSAGIGRSGTFCLVDSCLVLIEESGDINSVNIQEILLEMRRYRMGLIQTPDQLRFSYLAIIEGAKTVLANKNNAKNKSSDQEDNKEAHIINSKEKQYGDSQESGQGTSEGEDEEIEEIVSDMSDDNDKAENCVDNTEPPPLPPRTRRSVDLSPSSMPSVLGSENTKLEVVENSPVDSIANTDQQSIPCDHSQTLPNSKPATISNVEREAELRKRIRREKAEKTAQIIQKIKKKQQEAEAWSRRKSLIKMSLGGLILLLTTGVIVYKYYGKS